MRKQILPGLCLVRSLNADIEYYYHNLAKTRTAHDRSFYQQVKELSEQCNNHNLYPRPDLNGLNYYLRIPPLGIIATERSKYQPEKFENTHPTGNFAVIHDVSTGNSSCFGSSSTEIARFSAHEGQTGPALLFLRGHASPMWLIAAADKYNISPELYRTHLQGRLFALESRNLYISPSLPSSSGHVVQLTISTICSRGINHSSPEPEDLENDRVASSESLARYFHQLRDEGRVADSVVRDFLLLSKNEYVVEQTISIEVRQQGTGWRAVIWLDNGNDLSQCAKGPWSPMPGTRAWETYFLPVIVHHATNNGCLESESERNLSQSSSPESLPLPSTIDLSTEQHPSTKSVDNNEWKAAQNICNLPFQYGSKLDRGLARKDALYALSELFHFTSSSESQFLNLLYARIQHELSFIGHGIQGHHNATSLLNLKYIKTQLTSHIDRLSETISTLHDRHTLGWPCCAPQSSFLADQTAALLLMDLQYLLQRAEALTKECEHGMATLANSSILEESRRAFENAERVKKLTVLATLFIPLSFTCSIFGMNFKELGNSGELPLWIWGATTGFVLVLSFVIYHLDVILSVVRRKLH
jgi:hypothetical protein